MEKRNVTTTNATRWTRDELDQVIRRYAPVLYLHPDERYFPSTVEWFLARALAAIDDQVVLPPLTPAALPLVQPALAMGQPLKTGQSVISPGGSCYLIMQADANLCLYAGTPTDKTFLWGSLQMGPEHTPVIGQYHAIMQSDGNLCVYNDKITTGAVWGSKQAVPYATQGHDFVLSVEDRGPNSLVAVYRAGAWTPLWTSKDTSPNHTYRPSGHLDIPSGQAAAVEPGDLGSAVTYVRARADADFVDLQFWCFYPFNGPGTLHLDVASLVGTAGLGTLGAHVGDWEHVVLRVDVATKQLRSVYFSQHEGGEWVDVGRLERQGERVVVYASRFGHASYPHPGDNPTHAGGAKPVLQWYLVNACDRGATLDCAARHQLISSNFVDVTEPAWLNFPYDWGPKNPGELSFNQAKELVSDLIKTALGEAALIAAGPLLDPLAELVQAFAKHSSGGPSGPKQKSSWNGKE